MWWTAPGSVEVDLAAERGGNCELTRPDQVVVEQGVTILGPTNLPASVPYHASQMYAKNVTTFLLHVIKDGGLRVDAGYQGGDRVGQAGAPPVRVVVADPGLLQPSVVDHLRTAPGQLDQGLGDDRVALLPQVDVGLGYIGATVGLHAGKPVAYLGLSGGQDLLRVVRILPGEEREPGLFVAGFLLAAEGAEFDVVFVDAPYRNDLSHEVLQCLNRLGLAAAEAWIVVGQSKRAPSAPEAPQALTRHSVVTIGDHRIAFYRRPPVAAPSGS